jgi:predicted amidohydrolase YtcJ
LAREPGEPLLDASSGALLPGLHDHHLHLFAMAAAASSTPCGPPRVRNAAELALALGSAVGSTDWLRGVGYHESVAGELTRSDLDALVPGRPVRIQHRSGALWMLNSEGVERVGLDRGADTRGVERDASGRATGRLFGLDGWLRERIQATAPPSLAEIGHRLARFGVTGVTDATADNGPAELRALTDAVERGDLPQHLVVMGRPDLPEPHSDSVERGAVKLLLRDEELPPLDQLEQVIRSAHRDDRAAAIHCVTRAQLVLALSAYASAGCHTGDRIEHAAVAPAEAMELLAELPLTVVTQPNFVRERGDAYVVEVEERDRPWLYRCQGFLDAHVPLGAGTDAPFGDADPWLAMRAAVERRTDSGICLGPAERLTPERALALFTSPPGAPGGAPRPIAVGSPADLCLLDRPWSAARIDLCSSHVAATVRAGSLIWES